MRTKPAMLRRPTFLGQSRRWLKARLGRAKLKCSGYCPTCGGRTLFFATNDWLRDSFLCMNCGSLPRERALMSVLDDFFPSWREKRIHESSPADRGASRRLAAECSQYTPTQYFPDVALGSVRDGIRCESLEALTFPDESFDLHVTQDVLEHVFRPDRVFREIARTLEPGGAHVCTVPLVNKERPSRIRASMTDDGSVCYVEPPQYHGNPISEKGSLVTMDWGYDLCDFALRTSGLQTTIRSHRRSEQGYPGGIHRGSGHAQAL